MRVERPGGARCMAAAASGGVAAGIAIWLLTQGIASSGPQWDHWSFRGNGALSVPPAFAPIALATGWTMISLRYRRHPAWLRLGLLAGAIGLAIVLAAFASLFLLGVDLEGPALVGLALWCFPLAPVLSGLLVRDPGIRPGRSGLLTALASALLLLAGLVVGLAPIVLVGVR